MDQSNEMSEKFIPLSENEINLIQANIDQDVKQLALSKAFTGVNKRAVVQISARQKAKQKLPEWFNNPAIYFPVTLSIEQASSEATARYKSSLIKGNSLVDLTLGMGIDTYYLSENFQEVTGYEQQPDLAEITKQNFNQLGKKHIQVLNESGVDTLNQSVDWIYLDPARRDQSQRKVVALSDCTPDITEHLPTLFKYTHRILLKTSPVLDIDLAIKSLHYTTEVHVVGYDKECKEVLYIIDKDKKVDNDTKIIVAIVDNQGESVEQFSFTKREEQETISEYSEPLKYIYEPHPAVLKSGAFKILTQKYAVKKIANDSHLYTSEYLISNFPGRKFIMKETVSPDAKSVLKSINTDKANLTIRNFPSNVNDLRKKLRLKEGGSDYLFATTLATNKKVILVTNKL